MDAGTDSILFPQLPTFTGEPTLAGLLSLAITFLLPLIAALFMRASWRPSTKGLVLLAAAVVKAYLEAWLAAEVNNTDFNFVTAAYATVVTFGMAVVAYFGILKNTKAQRSALAGGVVQSKVIDGEAVPR